MSYCRKGKDSDVYMYGHVGGYIDCCVCLLEPKIKYDYDIEIRGIRESGSYEMHQSKKLHTAREALEHLLEHKRHGHKVPKYAIKRLRKEFQEEEPYGE